MFRLHPSAQHIRQALLTAALLGILSCGGPSLRRFMFDLNRLYLEIHQHVEDENFEALAADGARLSALVKELRPMNPAPDFQAPLDRLAKASQAVTVAGRQHDPELGRKALADMGRSCTACHRVYR